MKLSRLAIPLLTSFALMVPARTTGAENKPAPQVASVQKSTAELAGTLYKCLSVSKEKPSKKGETIVNRTDYRDENHRYDIYTKGTYSPRSRNKQAITGRELHITQYDRLLRLQQLPSHFPYQKKR